ncbi:MAG: DmsC/YnfH family molybdoenzyme membrane anchor subunit [Syntrophaceticus sp.]
MVEYSLIAFSIFLQASIGVMLCMTFMQQKFKDANFTKAAYASAILAVVGLLFSLAKLGQPLIAYNAILKVGTSWLSREILFTGGFAAIAVIYVISKKFELLNNSVNNALLWAGSLVGLLAVFTMARVYTSTVIPAWNSLNVYVDFFAATITMGGVIFWALSAKELAETSNQILAVAILVAAIIQVAVATPYLVGIALQSGASAVGAAVLSDMGGIMIIRWLLVLGGAGALMLPPVVAKKSVNIVYSAAVVLILGQTFGRYIFYASGIMPGIG